MPKKEFLEAGQIVGTHGVRGAVRLQPWCDSPAQLTPLTKLYWDEGRTPVAVHCRPHKNIALVQIEGVDTVQAASLLRGKVLYLHRSDLKLPQGACFIQDLLGCRVIDADTGEDYGELTFVSATGANDVYRIVDGAGKEYLFPAVKHMIQEISLEEGVIRLLPIPGIFDQEGEEA